ncbi:MAG: hypothetical protein WBI17_13620 [Clostridiaceae bacterium]
MGYKYNKIKEIIKLNKKEELSIACEILNLEYTESTKEEELINILEEEFIKYPTELYYVLSAEDLRLLRKMFENDGMVTINEDEAPSATSYTEFEALGTLTDLCLIDSDVKVVDGKNVMIGYISKEFADVFKEFTDDNRIAHAAYLDEVAAIINGCLYYYGAIHIDELYNIVEKKMGGLEKKLFTRTLSYKYALSDFYTSIFIGEEEYIVDSEFSLYYDIDEIHHWGKGVGYKDYSKEELMAAADPLFIENMKDYKPFHDYFKKFYVVDSVTLEMFPEMPEDLFYDIYIADAVEMFRISSLSEGVIEDFMMSMDFNNSEEIEKGLELLHHYTNNLSRWEYKGHTPNDLKNWKMERSNVIPMKAYLGKKKK